MPFLILSDTSLATSCLVRLLELLLQLWLRGLLLRLCYIHGISALPGCRIACIGHITPTRRSCIIFTSINPSGLRGNLLLSHLSDPDHLLRFVEKAWLHKASRDNRTIDIIIVQATNSLWHLSLISCSFDHFWRSDDFGRCHLICWRNICSLHYAKGRQPIELQGTYLGPFPLQCFLLLKPWRLLLD